MDNTLHIIAIWTHVFGIALFVGPQFFLAFAWVPASRGIADMPTRVQAMRTVTRRFGYIAGIGLVLIVGAGSYLIADWRDYWGVGDEVAFTELRFGVIFIIKMNVFLVMLALVALHTFAIGPRLVDALDDEARGAGDAVRTRQLRTWSMVLSIAALVLTLAIMALGSTLSTGSYSLQNF